MIMDKGWSRKKYFLIYTAVFCAFCAGVFAPFLTEHKSFVWNQDGGPQYLPNLAYVGMWLRDTVRRALQGDVSLKMYDFTIGYGSDVYAAVKTRPLELLSAFVPVRYTEVLYQILVLLRLYLGGLSFSLFCTLWKARSVTLITGSMIYVFCGYTLYFAVRHPIFGFPLILLPLMLYGAERMIRALTPGRKKSGTDRWFFAPLALSVFLGFFVNYYFCYMCTAALAVYVLVRLPYVYRSLKEDTHNGRSGAGPLSRTLLFLLKMILVYLLGTAMAMAVLYPIIRELSSSARIAQEAVPSLSSLLHYDWKRYYRWILYLCAAAEDAGSGTRLSYAVCAVPALVLVLFTDRKNHRGAAAAFVACVLILLIPLGGYALSGFSSVTNRWIFIFSMLTAYLYVAGEDLFFRMNRRRYLALGLFTLFYLALAGYEYHVYGDQKVLVGAAALAAAEAVMVLTGRHRLRAARWILLLTAFVSCTLNGWLTFSPSVSDTLSEFYDSGTGITTITQSAFSRATAIEDDSFWRLDSNLITSNKENYSVILGYRSTSIYNSVLNGPLTYMMLDLEENGIPSVHRLQGLNSRTALEAISNVKYYLTDAEGDAHVPYGFVRRDDLTDTDFAVYENQHPLAFGFTCDACISQEDYEKLSAVQKQQVMLHAAVVEEVPAQMSSVSETPEAIETVSVALPEETDGLKRTKKGYRAGSGGGSFTISFRRKAGCECYVRFTGVDTNRTYAFVDIYTADEYTQMQIRGHDRMYSLNRSEYIVSLGYDQEGSGDQLTVHFPKGSYSLEGIELIYIPMDGYADSIDALNAQSLENVTFTTNRISGTAAVSGVKMMVFSIPYSEGWSALVDGVKTPLVRADDGYTGLMLEAGTHTVTLTYCRPGLKEGAVISAIGWLLFLWFGLGPVTKRKKRGD